MMLYAKKRGKDPHVLGFFHNLYYSDLAEAAEVEDVPEVYSNIYADALITSSSVPNFRNFKYTVLNNTNFIKEETQ